LAAEADDDSEVENTHPGTPGSAVHCSTGAQWKKIKRYTFDMRDLRKLMRINVKLSVKQVAKKSPKPNKCDPTEWDALPWDGVESNLEDVLIQANPSVYIMPVDRFVSPRKQDPNSKTCACSK
jgi:hypothetical protein